MRVWKSPSIILCVPYGQPPAVSCVQVRQKGFGLCWSNLLVSSLKYSHMEDVTRYVAVVDYEGIPATSLQHDAPF